MAKISYPFGQTTSGDIIHIDDSPRGLQDNVFCPECGSKFIAVKGEIVSDHFRHYNDTVACSHGLETGLHRFAKQTICEALAHIDYPRWHVGFQSNRFPVDLGTSIAANQEIELANRAVRVDVLAQFERELIAIEIFVAHRVDKEKIELFAQHGIAAFEIDLSNYLHADKRKTEWLEAVLYKALRYWLYPPKSVRDAEQPLREAWLKQQLEREQKAREAWALAEQKRLEEEQRLEQFNRRRDNAINIARERREHEGLISTEFDRRAAEQERHRSMQQAREAFNRLKQAEAEARATTAEAARQHALSQSAKDLFAKADLWRSLELLEKRGKAAPDLQRLIAAHDGYDRVTPEAWAKYDTDVAAWQQTRRDTLTHEQHISKSQRSGPYY
jgi:hypothetical protein